MPKPPPIIENPPDRPNSVALSAAVPTTRARIATASTNQAGIACAERCACGWLSIMTS